jgi:KaiC/GvpD/RAD55 family RecA-like ATPase
MSRDQSPPYAFSDHLQIEPIQPGSTVLVSGKRFSAAEDLARSMVIDGATRDEGGLFISTNKSYQKLLAGCRQLRPSLDTSRIGIIDCTGQESGRVDTDAVVTYVSTQSDLTGIGMRFSALYESLYASAVDGRIRTGLLSLSSLCMYVELRTLFRFAQTLAGRIDSAGGLGVMVIDPTAHDDQTVNTLSQVADAKVEVQAHDGRDHDGELRVRGLPNQPDEWTPFSLS